MAWSEMLHDKAANHVRDAITQQPRPFWLCDWLYPVSCTYMCESLILHDGGMIFSQNMKYHYEAGLAQGCLEVE